jgi:peptidoglycan hydrolase-like protein with peptidoglycan-binding domain
MALNNNGEKVAVDGYWGPKTSMALKDFQKQHGLQVNGGFDRATAKQLHLTS